MTQQEIIAKRLLLPAFAIATLIWLASLPHPFETVVGCLRVDAWCNQPAMLWTMVAADAAIFVAYCWIPVLALRLRREVDFPFGVAFFGTAAFVVFCGVGHLLDVVTTFYPVYWLSAEVRVATAIISLAFAAGLQWLYVPQIARFVHEARADKESLREALAEAQRARDEALAHQNTAEQRAAELARQQDALREAAAANESLVEQLRAAMDDLALSNAELEQRRTVAMAQRDAAVEDRAAASARAGELESLLRDKQALLDQVEASQLAIRQLGTVILRLHASPTILGVPIQGPLDSRRMAELQDSVASAVGAHGAVGVVVDLVGVSAVDTAVAQCLLQTRQALALMGCVCVITGLRAPVATAIVQLGVELPQPTFAELCDGMQHILRQHRRAA